MSRGSKEVCLVDENGVRTDAELHDEILNNDTAEAAVIRLTRERLIAQGEDPELMKRLYPIPGED